MRYTATNPDDLPAIGRAIRKAIADHGPVVVTVEPEEDVRTLEQNKRYWKCIVEPFQAWLAMPEGGGRTYTKAAVHAYLKMEILGGECEVIRGRMVTVDKASHNMKRKPFAEYMDEAEAHIIDLGVPPEMMEARDG